MVNFLQDKEYDIIVVGAGPAGLTSALYAGRSGRSCIVLEKFSVGGQLTLIDVIENYPGFKRISGPELANRLEEQVREYNVPIRIEEVTKILDKGERKIVKTVEGEYVGKAVIIATGTKPKQLNVPGEKEFYGRGVSYCALCDGYFFKNKVVAVVGGGDSAVKEAVYLSNLAKKVYIIHRRNSFRAEKEIQKKAFATKNIEILWSTVVTSVNGSNFVESLSLKDLENNREYTLPVDGLFIYVGFSPSTEIFEGVKNEEGFIVVDGKMMTSIPGIFAAGDCMVQFKDRAWGQISVCVGDGAKAAISADEYVSKMFSE
jgi:thioredoxin reductase (NADPH)